MRFKVYKKDASAPCRSVFMVLEALNLKDVEFINVNLAQKDQFKDDYLKLNPQHTVPTLVDGDFAIWDSHAISTYLINKYAKDDSLYPKDPQKRALVDQRLHFDGGILFPALKENMIPLLYHGAKSFQPEGLAKIRAGYEFLESFLSGPWLTGDSLTVADICIGGTLSSLTEILPIDASVFPKLSAWFGRISKQDFYVKANTAGVNEFKQALKTLTS